MIREIIVTSPSGVRLAFTSDGEKGLEVMAHHQTPDSFHIHDKSNPSSDSPGVVIGIVPTSWLIELNDVVT